MICWAKILLIVTSHQLRPVSHILRMSSHIEEGWPLKRHSVTGYSRMRRRLKPDEVVRHPVAELVKLLERPRLSS